MFLEPILIGLKYTVIFSFLSWVLASVRVWMRELCGFAEICDLKSPER